MFDNIRSLSQVIYETLLAEDYDQMQAAKLSIIALNAGIWEMMSVAPGNNIPVIFLGHNVAPTTPVGLYQEALEANVRKNIFWEITKRYTAPRDIPDDFSPSASARALKILLAPTSINDVYRYPALFSCFS